MFMLQTAPAAVCRSNRAGNNPRVAMIAAITHVVEACRRNVDFHVAEALAETLAEYSGDWQLLDGFPAATDDTGYARQPIHAGQGFSIEAAVWKPGQMSPVHGHHSWYVLGVHSGALTEVRYRATRRGWEVDTVVQRRPGDVSHYAAHDLGRHRLANLGTEDAISLHVFGAGSDPVGYVLNTEPAALSRS